MPGGHRYPTISFRVSPQERDYIEAKIKVSGLQKKDYFVRSCIYNQVCVVGKKELIDELVAELKELQEYIRELIQQSNTQERKISSEGMAQFQSDILNLLQAILWMLDGAEYLWKEEEGHRN